MNFFIAVLDLPQYSRLTLDGQTIIIKTNDFVGIKNLPDLVKDQNQFHFLTITPAVTKNNTSGNDANTTNTTITTGFVLCSVGFQDRQHLQFIRKYNPQTEEVEANAVDTLAANNLIEQILNNQIPPTRILDYDSVVNIQNQNIWKEQTNFINQSNILQLRGIQSCDKLVPGSYQEDDNLNVTTPLSTSIIDGKTIQYPPIPVIDPNVSMSTHKHIGTQKYLAKLLPKQRTQFMIQTKLSSQYVLQTILGQYYHNSVDAILGDIQFSYIVFIYLHCLSSLEHWKDLIAMIALSTDNQSEQHQRNDNENDIEKLYAGMLQILPYQLSSIEVGFLEDIGEAGDNFLLPSLQRIQRNLCFDNLAHNTDDSIIEKFQHVLVTKFPQTFTESSMRIQELQDDVDMTMESYQDNGYNNHHDDENDDEDGPVMVSTEEVEASMARSAAEASYSEASKPTMTLDGKQNISKEIQTSYPILVAAVLPHEDIVMTCARALDEKNDVSLVREAAAYLENIEQYK